MLYVAWKRELPRKFARFVLFRPIKKRYFNLLCVLDLSKNLSTISAADRFTINLGAVVLWVIKAQHSWSQMVNTNLLFR